jgi:hypothetical protein
LDFARELWSSPRTQSHLNFALRRTGRRVIASVMAGNLESNGWSHRGLLPLMSA